MATVAGIDIETTNSNPDTGGILSIGIFIPLQNGHFEFYGTVQPQADAEWSYEACQVNGFNPGSKGAPNEPHFTSYIMLDYAICRQLEQHGFTPQRRLLPVGWNVGSFDMQYIRRYLPNLYKRCSYSCIDLNSIVSYLVACGHEHPKARVKAEAQDVLQAMGISPDRHNALYDARVALWELELLKQEVI